MTSFTVDAAVDPDAFERFAASSLPSTDEEVWRYSRIADLDLDAYRVVPSEGADSAPLPDVGRWSARIVVRNGGRPRVEVAPGAAALGLVVGPLDDRSLLASVRGPAEDAPQRLHDAFVASPVLVRVPRGVTVPDPVVVVHHVDADGAATFPHLIVQAGEDSELTVYDHHSSADVRALVVPQVELDVGDAARLRYVHAQMLGRQVWQIGRQSSRVGRDAHLVASAVALGGDYARMAIDSALVGKGGSGDLQALYFGEADQMHDFRTLQHHVAPRTSSELLFKGVVQGAAHAVYTGLIRVGKEAAGTNALQTNRIVKLSDHSWAESVPNLEIENNDVRCSHASAVGPVDEEQRFYLESRGVSPELAEQLIVVGFLDDVLQRLPVPGSLRVLREELLAKLARRDAA